MNNLQEMSIEQIEKILLAKKHEKIQESLQEKTLISTSTELTKYDKILEKICDGFTKKVSYTLKYKTGAIEVFRFVRGATVTYLPQCELSHTICDMLGSKFIAYDTMAFLVRLGYNVSLCNDNKTEAQKERNLKFINNLYESAQKIAL